MDKLGSSYSMVSTTLLDGKITGALKSNYAIGTVRSIKLEVGRLDFTVKNTARVLRPKVQT